MGKIFCNYWPDKHITWSNIKKCKTFYNPVNGKFEPIGFDGHYGLGNINNFIILDFLTLITLIAVIYVKNVSGFWNFLNLKTVN